MTEQQHMRKHRLLMHDLEQRIADLHREIDLLRTALQATSDKATRQILYACLHACFCECAQLVAQRRYNTTADEASARCR